MAHPNRLQLLHFLFGIAHADKEISQVELNLLATIGRYLGISQVDFNSIRAMFGFSSGGGSSSGRPQPRANLTAAYQILEIQASASDDELKKAYRKMAKKHHPDRVASLGEDLKRNAKEKFQKIQEAYEQIKTSRGLS
jgi:DnaJ like chaperone protein